MGKPSAIVFVFLLFASAQAAADDFASQLIGDPHRPNPDELSWMDPVRGDRKLGQNTFPDWLVRVSSTYRDEATGKAVRLTGTGTIVSIGESYFILSDSHLSQGPKDLEVTHPSLGKLEIDPAQRLADNHSDLELIRLKKRPKTSAFTWNPKYKRFAIDERFVGSENAIPIEAYAEVPVVPWIKENPTRWRFSKNRIPQPWESRIVDDLFSNSRVFRGSFVKSYLGSEIVSDSGVVAGLSGSPVIQHWEYKNGMPTYATISGLTKSYHRYFGLSYFSTAAQIRALVEEFEAGRRGKLGTAAWRFRHFTYRELAPGTQEVLWEKVPSGNIEVLAGNGTSIDGGNGTSVDGGQSNLRTISPAKLGILPGMTVDGQPVMAFEVNDAFLIYADSEGYDAIRKLKDVKIRNVGSDEPIAGLVAKKLMAAPSKTTAERPLGSFNDMGACHLEVSGNPPEKIRIRLPHNPRDPQTGPFLLELDKRGMVAGADSAHFDPIIRVRSASGARIRVDLRGLFSVAMANLKRGFGFDYDQFEYFEKRPYVEMELEGYRSDRFFCYPANAGVFVGAKALSLDREIPKVETAPCPRSSRSPMDSEMIEDLVRRLKAEYGIELPINKR